MGSEKGQKKMISLVGPKQQKKTTQKKGSLKTLVQHDFRSKKLLQILQLLCSCVTSSNNAPFVALISEQYQKKKLLILHHQNKLQKKEKLSKKKVRQNLSKKSRRPPPPPKTPTKAQTNLTKIPTRVPLKKVILRN